MNNITSSKAQLIPVWDIFVRVFHWLLVGVFTICFITQEENYDTHLISGYAVVGLITFRLLWGFLGTKYARFSNFVYSPRTAWAYLKDFRSQNSTFYIGHNPLGGYMVIALITMMFIITFSGVALDAAENRSGPLASTQLFYYTDQIAFLHDISTDITVALIVLHILGVMFSGVLHKENLVKAMITGKKLKSK
jgi:cytochrome b